MTDLKFGDRTYRKMGDTWMVQPATLMRGFIAVSEESTIAMLDEIVYLQTEFSAVLGDAIAKDAEIMRLRAGGSEMADALRMVIHDRPSAHADDVWLAVNKALMAYEEDRHE